MGAVELSCAGYVELSREVQEKDWQKKLLWELPGSSAGLGGGEQRGELSGRCPGGVLIAQEAQLLSHGPCQRAVRSPLWLGQTVKKSTCR